MQRSHRDNKTGPITEMAVVDTFTKLIFGDEEFCDRESGIIKTLRRVIPELHHDGHRDLGEYLRGLGVSEMIQLVSRVRQCCGTPPETPAFPPGAPLSSPGAPVASRTRDNH